MSKLLERIEIETAPNPTAAVIWLHGLGASGDDFSPWARQMKLDDLGGIRFIFPHANTMPVTISNGYIMRAWYDIVSLNRLDQREDEQGLRTSQQLIEALIARELERGIPAERIILAGFSQGCVMTLQTGLRYPQRLAGLMCLSGYLPLAASVAQERSPANQSTPIFMGHGRSDDVIPMMLGERSRDALSAMGYDVEWHDYPMPHSTCMDELNDIVRWIRKVLA
ncbi:alpha/beta hydrolase [Massilia sp. CF038]|uniref:alpha/beta hydrolase n=1 Tax=Massilia sp. CF038 TaxID=1881045 RepID=UPI0009203533|nr:carboxylesterase [Massilia sp. CF038]SHH50614.1 phospholipase/carboxylesterase [Massilia sp. CF038]